MNPRRNSDMVVWKKKKVIKCVQSFKFVHIFVMLQRYTEKGFIGIVYDALSEVEGEWFAVETILYTE